MNPGIVEEIKKELIRARDGYIKQIGREYELKEKHPVFYDAAKEFLGRPGKMVRPVIFALSYMLYSGNPPGRDLYRSALGFELLHNCAVIHDDIIDNSEKRRGGPAMHRLLKNSGKGNSGKRGEELAIVAGDILYALGIKIFMEINSVPARKEKALDKVLDTAVKTGLGEFEEMLLDKADIRDIKKKDILRVYDYKSACYTVSGPLQTGAILGGASKRQVGNLGSLGNCIGRAFQIKDDILDLYESGKSRERFEDIRKKRKTILMFYAYMNASPGEREEIEGFLSKKAPGGSEVERISRIFRETGSVEAAALDIRSSLTEAEKLIEGLSIGKGGKRLLGGYSLELVSLKGLSL